MPQALETESVGDKIEIANLMVPIFVCSSEIFHNKDHILKSVNVFA